MKRPSARRPGRTGGSPWLCGSLLDAAGAGWPPLALPGVRSPSSLPPGTSAVSAWRAGRLRRLGPCRAGWGPALSPLDQRAAHPGHQRPESAYQYSACRARVRLCAFSAHGRNGRQMGPGARGDRPLSPWASYAPLSARVALGSQLSTATDGVTRRARELGKINPESAELLEKREVSKDLPEITGHKKKENTLREHA